MLDNQVSNSSGSCSSGSWRQNWFVENVLAEIPILGTFFQTESIPEAIQHASKHAAMLLGGSFGMAMRMMINASKNTDHRGCVDKMSSADSMGSELVSMVGYMAVGMMAGTVTYNMLTGLGRGIYNYYKPEPQPKRLHINTTDDEYNEEYEKRYCTFSNS